MDCDRHTWIEIAGETRTKSSLSVCRRYVFRRGFQSDKIVYIRDGVFMTPVTAALNGCQHHVRKGAPGQSRLATSRGQPLSPTNLNMQTPVVIFTPGRTPTAGERTDLRFHA